MRYAMIMAGGSGTRLWPMSRRCKPKQLIPFLDGHTLLDMAWERLEGLFEPDRVLVCAAEAHRDVITQALPRLQPENFIGEPVGRDTLNAVALSAMVISLREPQAVMAVVTADHIIHPKARFQKYLDTGLRAVEQDSRTLVTFGITPTAPATGFGYLELGDKLEEGCYWLKRFKEKPPPAIAEEYFRAGPERYLWNSGMFVWRVDTLLECVQRYEPETYATLTELGRVWNTPERDAELARVYPTLKKISVDYAVMEPASVDPLLRVLAVPMTLEWMDVGNWRSFALTCPEDEQGNRLGTRRAVLEGTRGTLVASSDPDHLIAVVGCEDLMVIHTPDATLICPAHLVERVKDVTALIEEQYGSDVL